MVSDDWEMRDVVMGLCDGREEMSLGFTQEGRRKVIHKKTIPGQARDHELLLQNIETIHGCRYF